MEGRRRQPYLHELHVPKEPTHWHWLIAVVIQEDAAVHLQWGCVARLCLQGRPVLCGGAAVRLFPEGGTESWWGRATFSLCRASVAHSSVGMGLACHLRPCRNAGFLACKQRTILSEAQGLLLTQGLRWCFGQTTAIALRG